MNYKELFERWVALSTMDEKDRQSLVERIHEEVTVGVQALAGVAAQEMEKVLGEANYGSKETYLKLAAPVLALAAFDGYLMSLMERGINPQTASLTENEQTKGLGERWSAAYQKDQNTSYIQKIDPIISLLLHRMQELRVNQILSFHPEIVDLPYKTTEKLNQYFGWAVYQGYVMGAMESEQNSV